MTPSTAECIEWLGSAVNKSYRNEPQMQAIRAKLIAAEGMADAANDQQLISQELLDALTTYREAGK